MTVRTREGAKFMNTYSSKLFKSKFSIKCMIFGHSITQIINYAIKGRRREFHLCRRCNWQYDHLYFDPPISFTLGLGETKTMSFVVNIGKEKKDE